MKKETNDRDSRGDPPRDSSPRPSGPSGRIAVADSPLPPIPPPIFSQNYSRPPFTSIASNFYSQFGGFARPDNKPTSTSAASFVAGKNAADGPPGPQDRPSRDSSQYSNFPPHRGERERDDPYESGSDRLELDGDPAGPPPPKRSPPRSHRLPSSSDHEQRSPRHIQSDSTTDPTSPSHCARYEDEDNIVLSIEDGMGGMHG